MEDGQRQRYDFGKNCVCVGRVSTSSQNQTAQIEDLKKYATSLGYTHIQPFFTTESGFLESDSKIGWNLVTNFFETHPDYRVLICPEISRLSRRKSILNKIEEYLVEHKIQLIIKDINFFLFNEWGEIPNGNELVFSLFASLADSEMRQKKERFRRALSDYRKMGYSIGGKRLFGYERYYERKDGKERSRYRIDEDEAEQVRTIYKWYAYGIDGDLSRTSTYEITKKCIEEGFSHYLHSKRNVTKCLKERAYVGEKETHNRVHNAEFWSYHNQDKPKYIEGKSFICTYPPIIDTALYDKVQQRMKENNSKLGGGKMIDRSRSHTTILSKLIKCPNCGTYLHGEYRKRLDKRRPNVSMRYYHTYRCVYSRNSLHKCEFQHVLSMPLMDSVVWAYCKKAAYHILNAEEKKSTKEQIEEIDKKIANINSRIEDFNIEAKIKAEEAILRGKMARSHTEEAVNAAITAYENNVANLDKELSGYETRILELEQEKNNIESNRSLFGSLTNKNRIPTDKKTISQYIHRLVDSIEIVFSDKFYTVLRIHLKGHIPFYRDDEYICLKKRVTRKIETYIVRPFDREMEEAAIKNAMETDSEVFRKKPNLIIDSIPSKNNLNWDKDTNQFELEGTYFSLEELFEPIPARNDETFFERTRRMELSLLPIHMKEMEVERLDCYDEDKRD